MCVCVCVCVCVCACVIVGHFDHGNIIDLSMFDGWLGTILSPMIP